MMARVVTSDDQESHILHQHHRYNPFLNPFKAKPVIVKEHITEPNHLFLTKPVCGPLIFDNTSSDARDHCANERTFLSWLRLSIYLAIVACAIIISFHIQESPSDLEKKMALPLGLVFWVLALACLVSGFATYVRTIVKYSRRAALVQSGWKTHAIFIVVAFVIFGACVLFLITDSGRK